MAIVYGNLIIGSTVEAGVKPEPVEAKPISEWAQLRSSVEPTKTPTQQTKKVSQYMSDMLNPDL